MIQKETMLHLELILKIDLIFLSNRILVFDIVSQGSIDGSMDYSNIFIDADI